MDLSLFTVKELKAKLTENGLSIKGKKAELVERLQKFTNSFPQWEQLVIEHSEDEDFDYISEYDNDDDPIEFEVSSEEISRII